MTRKLRAHEECELHDWLDENRTAIILVEEGPLDGMYSYFPEGIYRVIVNNIDDAIWFRLKFC